MKSKKVAGKRLFNYLQGGINWKEHKDIILDFWIGYKCKDYGYQPSQFARMVRVVDLPTEAQKRYEEWFNGYDFQNTTDKAWLSFIDGTLNIFYHTKNPVIDPDDTWYVELMQSEVRAREIAETQYYHGRPNLNSFFRSDTNSKPEEVGGRRNGYIFSHRLAELDTSKESNMYWGIVFQCPETVTLQFDNNGVTDSRSINWSANTKHKTLVRVCADGRLKIVPVFVEGKDWHADRYMPEGPVNQSPMSAKALLAYITDKFQDLYGIWDDIDASVKYANEGQTARENAMNVMNDEEIKVGRVIPNIEKFIREGNVSDAKREYNKEVRKAVKAQVKGSESAKKEKLRNIVKAKKRAADARLAKLRVALED